MTTATRDWTPSTTRRKSIEIRPGRPRGPASCHPDRPHFAKGLCCACYNRTWKSRRVPACHPDLPYEARGLCHKCYFKMRREQAPPKHIEARVADPGPAPCRIEGMVQHVFETVPEACPKCHSPVLTYILYGVECQFGCGWTGYLVRPGAVHAVASARGPRGRYLLTA